MGMRRCGVLGLEERREEKGERRGCEEERRESVCVYVCVRQKDRQAGTEIVADVLAYKHTHTYTEMLDHMPNACLGAHNPPPLLPHFVCR